MSKFTPVSELEKKLDTPDSSPEEDLEIAEVPKKQQSSLPKNKILGVVKDIALCLGAFVFVTSPWSISALAKIPGLSSKTLVYENEAEGSIYCQNLTWKGFGAQALAFLVIIVVVKLLLYFGLM